MKKTIAILSSIIILNSCVNSSENIPNAPVEKRLELDSTSLYRDENYKVYTLEGCEYIVYGYGDSRWGTHKGNCKNPIHKQ